MSKIYIVCNCCLLANWVDFLYNEAIVYDGLSDEFDPDINHNRYTSS